MHHSSVDIKTSLVRSWHSTNADRNISKNVHCTGDKDVKPPD
jgi:hypothetical protein